MPCTMIVTSMPRLMMWRIESWMASPSVTLPPALLMNRVIGSAVVVRELAEPLDAAAGGVFFDVADQVDVAKPVGLLLAQLRADGVDELGDQAIAQLSHRDVLSHSPGSTACDRSAHHAGTK